MTAPDETREREHDADTEAPHPPGAASGPPGPAGTDGAPDSASALELRKPAEVSASSNGDLAARPTTTPDPGSRPGADLDTALPETAPARPDGDDPSTATGSRRRRPLRIAGLVVLAIAVVAGAGAASAGVLGGDGGGTDRTAPDAPPSTTEVKRTTLTRSETVDGTLGHGDVSAVQAPGGPQGGGGGVVTWVPADGDVIERGDAVYRVAEQKVPLLYGSLPLYRQMQEGSEGADVRMLEKNLAALGYSGFTADDEYTSGTADAVRDWQDDLGREETGTVRPGDAVIADGARRVADVKAVPGAPLSGAVLTWTGTERVVSVDLDAQYEDLVDKGTKATITLPDDTTVQAEVTDIGTPTTGQDAAGSGAGSGNGGSGDSDKATLPVELKVADQKKLGRYQAAAVDVSLKAETRENVLVVPINALVARQGGGYAVDVVGADGDVRPAPVEVGMFADSMVEVSGKGIADGTVVGVPK